MKVYILMFAEPYNDKEILGTFSTLDDAYEALCNSLGPSEKIEDMEKSGDQVNISTNYNVYWIYIQTVK